MNDISENIEEYISNEKWKILIIFDNMIANMPSKKKFDLIVNELFLQGRNLNFFLVFIIQSYFAVSKNIRLNSTYYFIMKISYKQELQQIPFNDSSGTDFKDCESL